MSECPIGMGVVSLRLSNPSKMLKVSHRLIRKKRGFHEVLKSPIARVGRVLFHGGVTERLVSKEQRIYTLLQKLKDATG